MELQSRLLGFLPLALFFILFFAQPDLSIDSNIRSEEIPVQHNDSVQNTGMNFQVINPF